jgi:hypothetical protein
VADWFKQHGRHPVYAKNQKLALPDGPLEVVLRNYDGRRRLKLVS